MRTWILASLLYAATAIAGNHAIGPSSQFLDQLITPSPPARPFHELSQRERNTPAKCCKVCTTGKPRGDTCIADVCGARAVRMGIN